MKNKWEEEYCKKFGLCESKGNCQCREELRFIRNLLLSREQWARADERDRLLKKIDELNEYRELSEDGISLGEARVNKVSLLSILTIK